MGYATSMHARTLGVERLATKAAVSIVVTPSHWITAIKLRVDAATREESEADLTWMLRCPYARLPEVKYRGHCRLAPTGL